MTVKASPVRNYPGVRFIRSLGTAEIGVKDREFSTASVWVMIVYYSLKVRVAFRKTVLR